MENNQQSKVETVFDAYGNLTETHEYGWGIGAPGAIVRTTQIAYLSTAPYASLNILNRPTQIRVRDGGPTGTIKSQTDIAYDEPTYINTVSPTGVPQHDDVGHGCAFTTRGNLTSVARYSNAAAQTGLITQHSYYDFFGNLRQADVSCCRQKQWNYSATTQYAYFDSAVSGPPGGPQLTTSASYNAYTGQISSSTDENGKATNYVYLDSLNRSTGIQRPDGAWITTTYDDTGRSQTTSFPIQGTDKQNQTISYNNLGRVVRRTVSNVPGTIFSIVETQYDPSGRPYKLSNPHNSTAQYWTTTQFDALGRPTKVIAPDNSQTLYTYAGTATTVTDPTGKARKSDFDALGQLVTVYEPDVNNGNALTQQTSYTYNVLDALLTVAQGVQTRTYSYDDLGRLLSAATPESNNQPVSYQYNSFHLVTQRSDARGVITTYGYDTLNRLTSASYNVGTTGVPATATVTLTYDEGGAAANALGRLTTMTDGVGTEKYTYDVLGRITQLQKVISGTTYTSGYAYNLAGELTSITYPSGRVVQPSYDTIGRLSTITSGATNYMSGYTYNPAGQVTGFNYGNGTAATLGYSVDRLQLTSLSYQQGANTLFSLSYGYTQNGGNNGQITSIADNVDATRSMTYTYDALYRLATATAGPVATPTWKLSWTYDRYGNRTAQTVLAGTGVPSNSITVDATTNRVSGYTYDSNGSLTVEPMTPLPPNNYTYDGENKLVAFQGSSGSGTYSYDGHGLRVKKVSGATTTVYIFSGAKVIAEYENGALPGSPTREYLYSGGQMLAKIEGGNTTYYHADHLSARVLTDASGAIAGQRGHYPYGETWYETGSTTKWQFTSYEREAESGNDYALARSYVNRYGRFSSPDPLAGSIANPQSLNRYAYVQGDPVNAVDPSGLIVGDRDGPVGLWAFFGSGNCRLDGGDVPCSFAFRLVDSGAGAVLPSGISTVGIYNGTPYFAVFDADGLYLEALGGAAFYYKNGDPVRILDLAPNGGAGGGGGDPINRLKGNVRELFEKKPKCAALFGDKENALKQLDLAIVYPPGTFSPMVPGSVPAYNFLVDHPHGAVYVSGNIFLGPKFFDQSLGT